MVLIIIIIILCGLLYHYYKPNIDFVIAEKGLKVLLWYNKWAEEDDKYVRKYKVLFKSENL